MRIPRERQGAGKPQVSWHERTSPCTINHGAKKEPSVPWHARTRHFMRSRGAKGELQVPWHARTSLPGQRTPVAIEIPSSHPLHALTPRPIARAPRPFTSIARPIASAQRDIPPIAHAITSMRRARFFTTHPRGFAQADAAQRRHHRPDIDAGARRPM